MQVIHINESMIITVPNFKRRTPSECTCNCAAVLMSVFLGKILQFFFFFELTWNTERLRPSLRVKNNIQHFASRPTHNQHMINDSINQLLHSIRQYYIEIKNIWLWMRPWPSQHFNSLSSYHLLVVGNWHRRSPTNDVWSCRDRLGWTKSVRPLKTSQKAGLL